MTSCEINLENMTECIQSEISQWVADTFKKDNFKEISAEITGSSEQGEGYLGNITFVKVTAVTFSGQAKEFHVVIKSGKTGEAMANISPIKLAYERENFFYDVAVPGLLKIEKEYGINITQRLFPKCLNTLSYENQQIVVLQNLKTIGYELHDRQESFDLDHLKLTLSNYGKYHALGLAYRQHRPKEFQELFSDLPCVMTNIVELSQNTITSAEKCLYMMLEDNKEYKIVEKLKKLFPGGMYERIRLLLKGQVNEVNTVIVHGDCWNNNYMFKYPELEATKPELVKFLDFQVSKLSSPVMDISYHIYATASEKELEHLKELLSFYYSSLSTTLSKLGCDPEKVFPYSELVRQWKKYSLYGLSMSFFVLQLVLTDKEDTIDIAEIGGDNVTENILKSSKSMSTIYPRMIAIAKNYLEFDDF